jgi:acyl carrier protein
MLGATGLLTITGLLDLRVLMALDEVNVQTNVPMSPLEPNLVPRTAIASRGRWRKSGRKYLQTPVSGPEDDFFDAGGDSLKAITFMIHLERAPGLELSLTLIMEAPKFAGLCEALREHRTTRYVPLVT